MKKVVAIILFTCILLSGVNGSVDGMMKVPASKSLKKTSESNPLIMVKMISKHVRVITEEGIVFVYPIPIGVGSYGSPIYDWSNEVWAPRKLADFLVRNGYATIIKVDYPEASSSTSS